MTSTDRTHYRELIAQVAEKAKAKLPEAVNGRIAKAVALVLQGDVEPPAADGSITVYSATDPTRRYVLHGTGCTCADFERGQAPQGWCCHRIAAGIQKRVAELLPAAADSGPEVSPMATPLPEAPCSVNVRAMIGNFETQITLRDHDETALLTRLQALLKRPDIRPIPKPAPRSGNWKRQPAGR